MEIALKQNERRHLKDVTSRVSSILFHPDNHVECSQRIFTRHDDAAVRGGLRRD